MKKTLYYKAIVREYDLMMSDGFIIAEIVDEKFVRLEGVFSEDFLRTEFIEDKKIISYFSRKEAFGEYEKEWTIELSDTELREIKVSDLELSFAFQSYVDIELHGEIVPIIAEIRADNYNATEEEKKKYDELMEKIKNNVFGKERN